MSLFELHNVSRYYEVDKKKKYVLKNVSLIFPDHGLITILGKSGSGKSTLLNLIGRIDSPSEGEIYFNKEEIELYKEKKLVSFRNQAVSYIFQHYHLLENQTALFNVMLPALIKGENYQKSRKLAVNLLKNFGINENLFNKRCADLSGGEKERIAILRSLINEPKVILADEPTGALDKENSLLVMETLKERSKSSLVIVVTHNKKLAEQYSDRIIYMSDGKIVKDVRTNTLFDSKPNVVIRNNKSNTSWLNRIVASNFIKRFRRNIFSISALTVGLVASMLIFGFANGKDASIVKSMEKQFDYGSASINKENKIVSSDSPIALIQTIRPNEDEINEIEDTCSDFHITYSYDALISPLPQCLINETPIDNVSYLPIYSFVDKSTNHDLLIKGRFPLFDTLNQVVINKQAYQTLKEKLKYDPLDSFVRIKDEHSYAFLTDDSEKPYITDYFVYDRLVQIVGVVDEIDFLNSPKIFYSFVAMDKYMDESLLNNLSEYEEEISWKQRVIEAMDNEAISSYSCRLFLKDFSKIDLIRNAQNIVGERYCVTANGLLVEETLFSLVDAASIGMWIFLAIALVGVVLILGIVSFASYNEDIKDSAILLCYGAKRDDIALIYVFESALLGVISVVLSFIISLLITKPINLLIEHFSSLIDAIDIPFIRFHNRRLLFPTLIVVATLFVCVIATYIPIGFSRKISLKEELKAND